VTAFHVSGPREPSLQAQTIGRMREVAVIERSTTVAR
jgi:hypothetical protein